MNRVVETEDGYNIHFNGRIVPFTFDREEAEEFLRDLEDGTDNLAHYSTHEDKGAK